MALIRGMRDTVRYTPNVVSRDIDAQIAPKQANRAPFYSMMSMLGEKPTSNWKFEHGEDDQLEATVTLSANANSGDVTLDLTAGHVNRLQLNSMLVHIQKKVLMRVTDLDFAGNIATVERPALSTTDANLVTGDVLVIMEAYEEGVNFRDAITNELSLKENHVHEVETAIEASWIQQGQKLEVEQDWQYQVQKAVAEHKEKWERICFFSKKGNVTGVEGKPLRTTDGVFWLIEANGLAAHKVDKGGALLTKEPIDEFGASLVQYGAPDRKIYYATPLAKVRLTSIADGMLRIAPSEKTLGIEVTRVAVNGRVISVVENQQLSRVGETKMIVGVDMANIGLRYFTGGGKTFKTRWYPHVEDPKLKGQMDVLYSVKGVHMKIAEAHGYFMDFA